MPDGGESFFNLGTQSKTLIHGSDIHSDRDDTVIVNQDCWCFKRSGITSFSNLRPVAVRWEEDI